MRTLLLNAFLILGLGTMAQDHCWIKYSYDAAGNRIKRYWWCGDPNVIDHEVDGEPKSVMAKDFGFRVFPNPAKENLQLSSEQELADADLEVVDLQGRSVYSQRISGTWVDIDVSKFGAGTYSLRLRTEQDEYTTTFSVAH
jgi:hypothetical protein